MYTRNVRIVQPSSTNPRTGKTLVEILRGVPLKIRGTGVKLKASMGYPNYVLIETTAGKVREISIPGRQHLPSPGGTGFDYKDERFRVSFYAPRHHIRDGDGRPEMHEYAR